MLGMASGLSLERARCLFQARLHEKQRLTLGRVGETRVASTTSKCQAPEKVWSSSPSAPFCLFALSLLCTCRSTLRDVKKKKKKWEITRTLLLRLLPLPLPLQPHTHTETLAIGHWTASLSVSLVNVSTTREGAKTKVLLRGIHCVNILAGELHEGKGGTV